MEPISIKIKQDAGVEKKIQQTAKRLTKKYNKKRWVNEKRLLKEQTPLQKCLSIFANILFWSTLAISLLLCLTTVLCRINHVPSSFLGYNHMKIVTGSMKASGFNVGDHITVRAVYTDSLKPGDKIAFYVYADSYNKYYQVDKTKINNFSSEVEYKLNIRQMFGAHIDEVKAAIKSKSTIVFHEIVSVYEDENGERWFKTKGTSNASMDSWNINEKMILGVYDGGGVNNAINEMLKFLSSNTGLITIIYLPQLLIMGFAISYALKNVQLAFLELDVVEEKRKLTDKICVKNDIGINMGAKTKLKVLAQAKENEKMQYVSLLWRKGEAPVSIQKYLMRKSIILRQTRKLLELNRKCEKKFIQGESPTLIAKFYRFEKQKIEQDLQRYQRLLKEIHEKYKDRESVNDYKSKN